MKKKISIIIECPDCDKANLINKGLITHLRNEIIDELYCEDEVSEGRWKITVEEEKDFYQNELHATNVTINKINNGYLVDTNPEGKSYYGNIDAFKTKEELKEYIGDLIIDHNLYNKEKYQFILP